MSRGVRDILKLFFRYPWRVALGVACLLVVDGAQLSIPLVVKVVIDGVASFSATSPWIAKEALIILGLSLAIAAFRFAWRHFFFSASRLAEISLRQKIFDHAMTLSARDFTTTRTGEVMALAMNDVETIRQALAMGFVAGFDSTAYAVVALCAMFWLDPGLTAMVILPLPLLAVVMAVSLKAVYERWDAVQSSFERMTEKVRESVAGMRILKAYVQRDGDCADFARYNEDYFKRFMHYTTVDALFHPLIMLIAGSCVAILLGAGGARVITGQTSVGSFVALTSYLGMLTWPMIAAGWMLTLVQRAAASMDRINAFFDRKPQAEEAEQPAGPLTSHEIDIRALTFTYPGSEAPSIRNLSVFVPEGGSLGVVGEIGSGKSTLVQILSRLYDPRPGSVFIGGVDITKIALQRLREMIAIVPQEAFLFSDTIAQNLLLGNPAATAKEIQEACSLAAISDEIEAFPNGYETLLGERGITLSGGQKQRLCLARALLKEAPVLLLDDTLSAVDAGAERKILAGLARARKTRTTIVVSHRVSAVRELDRILVLKRGAVIQQGAHAELMATEGYYREMAELQEIEQ